MVNITACQPVDLYFGASVPYTKLFTTGTRCFVNITLDAGILNPLLAPLNIALGTQITLFPIPAGLPAPIDNGSYLTVTISAINQITYMTMQVPQFMTYPPSIQPMWPVEYSLTARMFKASTPGPYCYF
jgi:hypothetical protein